MSDNRRGFLAFAENVLSEFQISLADNVADAAIEFIRDKFRAGYSVSATVRDLRAELAAQLVAQAAEQDTTRALLQREIDPHAAAQAAAYDGELLGDL